MLDSVIKMVTKEMNEALTKELTEEEVTIAVFQLGADKASGPDGFSGMLYQKIWRIIKNDMVEAVWSFFMNGRMMKEIYGTNVVLIPKATRA